MSGDRHRPYRPISDYGLIGNEHGAALVARDGSIDWCCLSRFDADPLFSRLLDRRQGGFFQISPVKQFASSRSYQPGTNILETTFVCPDGVVRLIDFMVAPEEGRSLPSLVRLLTGIAGSVTLEVSYCPVTGFREGFPELSAVPGHVTAPGCPTLFSPAEFAVDGPGALARVVVGAGQTIEFCLIEHATDDGPADPIALLSVAHLAWQGWSRTSTYDGPFAAQVIRSALVLKALSFRPTGAIVAAPTTSLPEEIGGVRNWDYRFCWIRDACLCFYALKKFGSTAEAERFLTFLIGIFEREPEGRLKPLYGISGSVDLAERTITHYEGYRGSAPVRAGNGAAEQHQLDAYGQLLDLIYLYDRLGGELVDRLERVAVIVADHVAAHWREPDSGIWEPRGEPQRYVHAAIMNWVALDRAVRLFGERPAWVRARDEIVAEVLRAGVHQQGYLTQVFGGQDVDAAVLIAPMVDFPLPDSVLAATVDKVIAELGHGSLVYRYKVDDGLPGEEGTFLICAFWLVDALAALGRIDEAKARFLDLLGLANDVGLYPEEIDRDGTFLGNFPQAFSHLGFIHSALVLDLYAAGGQEAVRGSYADRTLRETPYRRSTRVDERRFPPE